MKKSDNIHGTVSHLFRQESGKMVSVLVNVFGFENLELAEDVVQDALISALESWKFRGIPANPKAWLYRAAKNRAIDVIRHEKHTHKFDFSHPEKKHLNPRYTLSTSMESHWQEDTIDDHFLGMMYACCHDDISEESQITFILKSLCGFSTREIARAFLTNEDTVSKRLYRTREYFRKTKTKPEIPARKYLSGRTNAVLHTIYLIFSEGYNSTHSDRLIREDLISQAMFLCKSLIDNDKTHLPSAYALMALMCFHASRNESRLSDTMEIVPLAGQDRSRWHKELISRGNDYLNLSATGEYLSTYHLEAAIAYEHCVATDYAKTNWDTILKLYDHLLGLAPDPVIRLNRCIVLMELKGPKSAMQALHELRGNRHMEKYYLYHATLGELYQRLGYPEKAAAAFKRSRDLTHSVNEQKLLTKKIRLSWN